jgi:signal transduction histidine kinase
MIRIDVTEMVGDVVAGIQKNMTSLLDAARAYPELMDLARDAGRILKKAEAMLDRLDKPVKLLEEKLDALDISAERLNRLERAVFNIERATGGVEASMSALPRVLRSRIDRLRPQAAGETLPE